PTVSQVVGFWAVIRPPLHVQQFFLVFFAFSVASTTTVALIVVVSVVIGRDCIKVLPSEILSLDSVNPVFPLAVLVQSHNLVFSEPWGQSSIFHIRPWSPESRSPKPMVAVKIVVAPANEIHIIWNTYSYIDAGIGQEQHLRGCFHNYWRWGTNVHIY